MGHCGWEWKRVGADQLVDGYDVVGSVAHHSQQGDFNSWQALSLHVNFMAHQLQSNT